MNRNRKIGGVSLRTIYLVIIVITLIISGLMFYQTLKMSLSFKKLTEATDNQIVLDKAGHELMDASDYLTERVQRFAATGDKRFLDEYFKEAFENNRREEAVQKMADEPSVSAALLKLKMALDDSVSLMDTEYYAMRLVCDAEEITDIPDVLTEVELSEEDAALSPKEKKDLAISILLDDEYFETKSSIRSQMQESLYVLESLTRKTENDAFSDVKHQMIVLRIIILIQILIVVGVVWITMHLGIRPILKASKRIKEDRPIQESGANEFRYLARAYNNLNEKLNEENDRLKYMSLTDALTGVRNRMALRYSYDSYYDCDVTVMFMDIDDFKTINDTCGHEEGDRILKETGRLLADAFGDRNCYRYGGDEFLVISPSQSEKVFQDNLAKALSNSPEIMRDGEVTRIEYSIGYVHSKLKDEHSLRELFREADEKMYIEKNKKKVER